MNISGLPNLCGCARQHGYDCYHERCLITQRNYLVKKAVAQAAEIERLKKDVTYWEKMATAEDSSSEGESEPYILRPLKLKEVK